MRWLRRAFEWVALEGAVIGGGLVIFVVATWPVWLVALVVVWLVRHW